METPVTVSVTEVYRGLRLFRRTGLGDKSFYPEGRHSLAREAPPAQTEEKISEPVGGGLKKLTLK